MTRGKNRPKQWNKVAKTEMLTLYQHRQQPTRFRVNSSASGRHRRRLFAAPTIDAALRQAPIVAGLKPRKPKPSHLGLVDAFNDALSRSDRHGRSRDDWNAYVRRFLLWLADHHASCTHWHLLTRDIVSDYVASLADRAPNTRRLALQPIRQTARGLHDRHGWPDPTAGLRIGAKIKHTPALVYLTDVVAFLDWLRDHEPRLEAGAALQGLVGLQLQEATRLTWDRVDLVNGLVEISGNVKNRYRTRVIPLCDRARQALARSNATFQKTAPKVRPLIEAVVRTLSGTAHGGTSWMNWSKALTRAIRTWNPDVDWKPKDLRNCLPTFAATEGLLNDLWEQYLGHAPRTVTAQHYIPRLTSVTQGEAGALEKQMGLFRLHVTEPVNRAVAKTGSELHDFAAAGARPTDEMQTETG